MTETWEQRYEQRPVFWYYLHFAGEVGFLGGCYVLGEDLADVVTRSHLLGINPGGEIQTYGPIPPELMAENVPLGDRERLLTRKELDSNDRRSTPSEQEERG